MKNVILFLLLPIAGLSQEKFIISGKIGTLDAPAKMLIKYKIEDIEVHDSTALINGNFSFKGEVEYPVAASIFLKRGDRKMLEAITIYLENGKISIESKDSLKKSVIKGGPINTDYLLLQEALAPVREKNTALFNKFVELTDEERNSKENEKYYNEERKKHHDEANQIQKAFILKHPNSFISFEFLKAYAGPVPNIEDVMPLYLSLSEKIRNTKPAKAYAEFLETVKRVSVGSVAPQFVQNDPNGSPVSLSSFRGKYVLLDFWASWCGPCRRENPNLVKSYEKFKDKNFTILGISLDKEDARDKWLKAIETDQLNWSHVSDLKFWKNVVAVEYGIRAIPQNFLVDPNGVIIATNLRGEELDKKLSEILQ